VRGPSRRRGPRVRRGQTSPDPPRDDGPRAARRTPGGLLAEGGGGDTKPHVCRGRHLSGLHTPSRLAAVAAMGWAKAPGRAAPAAAGSYQTRPGALPIVPRIAAPNSQSPDAGGQHGRDGASGTSPRPGFHGSDAQRGRVVGNTPCPLALRSSCGPRPETGGLSATAPGPPRRPAELVEVRPNGRHAGSVKSARLVGLGRSIAGREIATRS
jgi:hypothetical protein